MTLANTEQIRNAEDFLYPKPSLSQRLGALFAQAVVVYAEGIDESKYQYSTTKAVNHATALIGGVTFTIIRISNCLTADPYFPQAWKDAMASGMPIMLYANVQGYAGGVSQARFAMETAAPFIAVCETKVVIFGDFEADGMTMSVAARQKLAMDFLNTVHAAGYETGIYSNVKYWGEMYGNLKPPVWAWLFGAHWTYVATGTFPASWDLSKLIVWQYGVWDNQSWALPVAGNYPDIDKDRWVWSGGSVVDFLQKDAPFPPEPPSNHEARITALEASDKAQNEAIASLQLIVGSMRGEFDTFKIKTDASIANLDSRISAIGEATPSSQFLITASVANARHAPTSNKENKPVMVIYPNGKTTGRIQFKQGALVPVRAGVVDADGTDDYYEIVQRAPTGEKLYLRAIDGKL